MALTLLDILSYLDEIPVCTAYEIKGKVRHDFPVEVNGHVCSV
ncbi:MAG: adenylosuccinate synthetase [Deltaproteobacteria bacterium]|nr:adenylosuccinate synthetase [Deltaproteobacteria bacterium]MBW2085533.1 adenylosuccinate synthetase [Deltaproteobacteria bacterium]